MKLLILLLTETLLFLNTSESPFNRTHFKNKNFISDNYNPHQQNSWYNEVQPFTQRNHRQFGNEEEGTQTSSKKDSNTLHSTGGLNNNNASQPSVPVAATLELPSSQHFSQVPITTNNGSAIVNGDRIIFPDDETNSSTTYNYTKEEIACFMASKVFYNDSCLELLLKGNPICDDGEWLVLDLKAAQRTPPVIKPKCAKTICKSNEFLWYKTKRCYELNDQNFKMFCPPGNIITNDFFGYGKCICQELYGLHTNGTCYQLYTQGPCSRGYLYTEKNNKTECSKNPCRNSSLVLYDKDKMCYELGGKGPCEPNFTFQVSKETRKPTCTNNIATLAAIGPPSLCATDANKQCQPEFKIEDSKKYIDRIISAANKMKGKP